MPRTDRSQTSEASEGHWRRSRRLRLHLEGASKSNFCPFPTLSPLAFTAWRERLRHRGKLYRGLARSRSSTGRPYSRKVL